MDVFENDQSFETWRYLNDADWLDRVLGLEDPTEAAFEDAAPVGGRAWNCTEKHGTTYEETVRNSDGEACLGLSAKAGGLLQGHQRAGESADSTNVQDMILTKPEDFPMVSTVAYTYTHSNGAQLTAHPSSCLRVRTASSTTNQAYHNPNGHIVCLTIDAIPPGRQYTRNLKCGVCNSSVLFNRKHELERHMRTHERGGYHCEVEDCDRRGDRAFKRKEHLRKHLKSMHGHEE